MKAYFSEDMFRPPSCYPHGGPPRHNNGPYPGQSVGMAGGAPSFVPSTFPMHGRGVFHPPFPGVLPYQGFPPSGPPSAVRPPPPPGSPPLEAPPPPPPTDGNLRSIPKHAPPPPPPMPKDPEMLKNIEVLSSFVVKNGPQFENMARAKQAGDPKFSFLFGGDRGTDAALGFDFYNWKKEHLVWVEERTRASPADQQKVFESTTLQRQYGGSGVAGLSHESPESSAGSDMDMEDDFALPDPAGDKKPGFDNNLAVPSTAVEGKPGLSPTSPRRLGASSPASEWKPEFSSPSIDRRPALSFSASDRKPVLLPHESVESKLGTPLNISVDQDALQQGANRGLSGHILEPEQESLGGKPLGEKTRQVSEVREITSSDLPKRRDTRRRTGFDRPCMEDVSPQGSPVRVEQQKDSLHVHDRDQKGTSGSGLREVPTKPSRWGPEPSFERLGSVIGTGETTYIGKGHKRSDTSLSQKRGETSSTKDRCQSPDAATKPSRVHDDAKVKDNEKEKLKSGLDQPAVDEFGRLLQQGGSDSDADDNHYGGRKKRRRTLSRSRSGSRSPSEARFKHWGPGQSPHRRGRRSRSWSRSPRRNRSHSQTPPREGRWGEGRGDRGGRRGGRAVGGTPPTCYDFVKGKCFRGSSCRFLHEESHGTIGDQGGRWSRGRGRDREQGNTGRAGEEGERNWGGISGDDKLRRPWESDEQTMEDNSREMKLIAELKKQEHASANESLKQEKGKPDNPVKSSEEPEEVENYQPVKSTTSELLTNSLAPSLAVPSSLQSQSSISMRLASQAGQQTNTLQQQSAFSSNIVSANHKLGSLVSPISQQSSFMVSPTPHSRQLQFSPILPHPQPPTFSMALQPQKPSYQPLPSVNQNNGFTPNTLHQQPPFTSVHNALSGSSALPNLAPPFAALPLGRPQTSFNSSQQPNFAPFPSNSGHGGIQFRPAIGGAPPQMLPSPLIQNLQSRPGLPWLPGGVGPPISYSLGPPQPNQQAPPHAPPVQAPPPQAQNPPPQVSAASTANYSYSLPLGYSMPSYSTLPSKTLALHPPPLMHDQYDPLADSLEPAPPGSVEKKGLNPNNQSQENSVKSSAGEQWRHTAGGLSAPLMTNAGEVVLENVSPGLPGHVENVGIASGIMARASPAPQPQIVMESVSPTPDVDAALNGKALTKLGFSQRQVLMENVSPPDQSPTKAGEDHNESAPKTKEEKKKVKEGRVLNLIRKAVAEHVKAMLKPTWKGGQMSKEAFKTIAKKAVDKVMGALEAKGQIPKTQEKVDAFMKTSKPKIAKLVQGYVDKYVKV